jgi:hypothetical protein
MVGGHGSTACKAMHGSRIRNTNMSMGWVERRLLITLVRAGFLENWR